MATVARRDCPLLIPGVDPGTTQAFDGIYRRMRCSMYGGTTFMCWDATGNRAELGEAVREFISLFFPFSQERRSEICVRNVRKLPPQGCAPPTTRHQDRRPQHRWPRRDRPATERTATRGSPRYGTVSRPCHNRVTYMAFRETNSRTPSLTSQQLDSTASYASRDLPGIRLSENDLTGWNFEKSEQLPMCCRSCAPRQPPSSSSWSWRSTVRSRGQFTRIRRGSVRP